ncbi:ABC transporter ATP-binding protein [Paraglaciecola hydrolytica]|uniref:Macrolide ABC transporter ATP-binding protein n=1 Tax=Paraglaciecola hydrolytica TaxID=1799789 RepID=A0A135ZZL8_9ALTE|nr:ABC transporter ATP-binding protein [Paraglaciecola hydrolytica]KXI28421.1 macrolide ABC transporter ATP-binding protein [Paraglaciecola hydrolytica]
MSQALIKVRQAKKVYQMGEEQVWALKGVDLDIQQGEFVAIMGSSGSGKSTMMNLLGCLDIASEGSISLDGVELSKLSKNELATIRNQRIGFVFQQFNLLPRTTALDNVTLPLLYSQVPESEWPARASSCLQKVGLGSRMDHHPSQLSGGQQQRVAIARALVNEPVMILADEPTGALDTQTGLEVMTLFQELNQQGKTIILVTHEPDIAQFASRKLIFRDGELVADEVNPSPKLASQMQL